MIRLAECFSKIQTLHDTWWGLEAFKRALSAKSSSQGPSETDEEHVSVFIENRVANALDSSSKAHPEDAGTVIEVAHEYSEDFFDQK